MIKQDMLRVTPILLVTALMLAGCANKQSWSPALEDAQETYERISQDPIVASPQPAPSSAGQVKQQLLAINAKPSTQGMSLILGDRYFDQGTARLWNGRAARHLDNVASILSKHSELILKIESHTDNALDADSNYDLSIDRAMSIKSALVLRGIDESRIDTQGFGHTKPVAANSDPIGRLQNRRIELIFPNVQL